jgi:hypothetical protein
VRISVPLDVETHARLCGLAARKSMDRSALAAKFVTAALKGFILFDKRKASDRVEDDNRPDGAGGESDSGEEEAA